MDRISSHHQPLISMTVLISIFLVVLLSTCKNPSDFEPDDPYIDPPGPPLFILPLPDTTFNGYYVLVLFDWSQVVGAEQYEIQFDTNTAFPTDSIHAVSTPPATIIFRRTATLVIYYYRMRALSSSWYGGHTAWTATRRFYLRPDP